MKSNIKLKMCLGGLATMLLLSSCLKHNLPRYPASGLDYLNKVYFQYRWLDSNNLSYGQPVVAVENLTVNQTVDSMNNVISVQIEVPAANGDFNDYRRNLVAQTNLWCTMDVSPAATVTPVGDSPVPAYAGDFSVPRQYKVAAADPASSRTWTITVTSFTKP